MSFRRLASVLFLSGLASGAGSCSLWEQLGKSPSDSDFVRFEQSPQFNGDKKAFENRQAGVENKMWERMDWRVYLDFFLEKSERRRPESTLPEVKPPDLEGFLAPTDSIKFIWFGHSTLLVNLRNTILLIDPVFSNSAAPVNFLVERFQPPVLRLEELPPVDYVLISHDHYDHLDMRTIQFLRETSAVFIVPLGIPSHLRYWGIPPERIHELDWWQELSFGELRFVCTPAQHFSGRTGSKLQTLWASWSVESGSQRFYFSGDSGYDEHYRTIGERLGPFDLAFVESGQYNPLWREVHNLPEDAVQAALDLRAEKMAPIHWGMFELAMHDWDEPIRRTQQIAQERGLSLLTPQLGQLVDLSQPNEFTDWWEAISPISD